MAGTSWPDLTAGKKAKASEVESKFDWSEGDVVPHSAGTLANNTYTLGVHSAGTFYYWKAGYVMALNPTTTAQGIAIGKDSAQSSASLDLSAMPKALIVPFLTTTQRNALSATSGMFLFNTTANRFERYEGGQWSAMNSPIGLTTPISISTVSTFDIMTSGSGRLRTVRLELVNKTSRTVFFAVDGHTTPTLNVTQASMYLFYTQGSYYFTTAATFLDIPFKSSFEFGCVNAGTDASTGSTIDYEIT